MVEETCPGCNAKFDSDDGVIGASGNLVCEACYAKDY